MNRVVSQLQILDIGVLFRVLVRYNMLPGGSKYGYLLHNSFPSRMNQFLPILVLEASMYPVHVVFHGIISCKCVSLLLIDTTIYLQRESLLWHVVVTFTLRICAYHMLY